MLMLIINSFDEEFIKFEIHRTMGGKLFLVGN